MWGVSCMTWQRCRSCDTFASFFINKQGPYVDIVYGIWLMIVWCLLEWNSVDQHSWQQFFQKRSRDWLKKPYPIDLCKQSNFTSHGRPYLYRNKSRTRPLTVVALLPFVKAFYLDSSGRAEYAGRCAALFKNFQQMKDLSPGTSCTFDYFFSCWHTSVYMATKLSSSYMLTKVYLAVGIQNNNTSDYLEKAVNSLLNPGEYSWKNFTKGWSKW